MRYLPLLESHFAKQISQGTDVYGPRHTPMWMAVIDTRTGRYPDYDHTPARVYRLIGAPKGVSLYWDQPLVVAAHALSDLTLQPQYRDNPCPPRYGLILSAMQATILAGRNLKIASQRPGRCTRRDRP